MVFGNGSPIGFREEGKATAGRLASERGSRVSVMPLSSSGSDLGVLEAQGAIHAFFTDEG